MPPPFGHRSTRRSLTDIDELLNVNVRAPFVASKAALAHLTKVGRIITMGGYVAERVPPPVLSGARGHHQLVAFLASAKAQYITGATLTVDGGVNA